MLPILVANLLWKPTNTSDYLNRIRITKAIHLLKNTSWKSAAIAEAVGFSNITYFFTIFKKITGKRPGDYRDS